MNYDLAITMLILVGTRFLTIPITVNNVLCFEKIRFLI